MKKFKQRPSQAHCSRKNKSLHEFYVFFYLLTQQEVVSFQSCHGSARMTIVQTLQKLKDQRLAEVSRVGPSGSNSCSVRDTQSRGFRIKFSQVQRSPKVSKEHTPQPLWEIRIIAYHLHSTKMFSASQTEHLVPHLCPLPLVLALGTLKKA